MNNYYSSNNKNSILKLNKNAGTGPALVINKYRIYKINQATETNCEHYQISCFHGTSLIDCLVFKKSKTVQVNRIFLLIILLFIP